MSSQRFVRVIGMGFAVWGGATVIGCGDGDGSAAGAGGAGSGGSLSEGSSEDIRYVAGDKLALGVVGAEATVLSGVPKVVELSGSRPLVGGWKDGDFWIARYESDGSVDSSFGSDGETTINFPAAEQQAGLTFDFDTVYGFEQTTGGIFLAGAVQGWNTLADTSWGVARLNSDGTWDESFADDGFKIMDWTVGARAYQIDAGAGDALYVTGTIENASTDIAVVRLSSAGEVDASFSLTGTGPGAVVSDNSSEDGLFFLRTSERLVVGGGPEFGVAALQPDGPYDESFGDSGWSKPREGLVYAMAPVADDKLLLAGIAPLSDAADAPNTLTLVRLNADGSVDTSFANSGEAVIDYDFGSYVFPELEELEFNDAFLGIKGLSVLPDGRVLIFTDVLGFLVRYPALVMLQSDGSLDSSFGQGGLLAFPLGLPLLGSLVPEPAVRLASDGETAWFVEDVIADDGTTHGALVVVDLAAQ